MIRLTIVIFSFEGITHHAQDIVKVKLMYGERVGIMKGFKKNARHKWYVIDKVEFYTELFLKIIKSCFRCLRTVPGCFVSLTRGQGSVFLTQQCLWRTLQTLPDPGPASRPGVWSDTMTDKELFIKDATNFKKLYPS